MTPRLHARHAVCLSLVIIIGMLSGCGSAPVELSLDTVTTAEDGSFSVGVPEGWAVLTLGDQITLASSQAQLTTGSPNQLGADDVLVSVFIDNSEQMGIDPATDTVVTALEGFRTNLLTASGDITIGEIQPFEVEGRQAASITVSYGSGDQITLVINLGDDRYGFVTALLADGQAARFDGVVRAIAGSINPRPVDAATPIPTATEPG